MTTPNDADLHLRWPSLTPIPIALNSDSDVESNHSYESWGDWGEGELQDEECVLGELLNTIHDSETSVQDVTSEVSYAEISYITADSNKECSDGLKYHSPDERYQNHALKGLTPDTNGLSGYANRFWDKNIEENLLRVKSALLRVMSPNACTGGNSDVSVESEKLLQELKEAFCDTRTSQSCANNAPLRGKNTRTKPNHIYVCLRV